MKDGRDCEYEFILWSFLGELALEEEMWTVSVYLCILLALRKIWEGKKNVLGQFKKKNCTKQKWYFLFYLFYFISVYTGCIVMYHKLRHSLPLYNKSNKFQFKSLYSYSGELFISDADCHDNIRSKRLCTICTCCPNQY